MEEDKKLVEHPSHYQWMQDYLNIEVLDITRWLNNNKGNVLKYVLRGGHKLYEGKSAVESDIIDCEKALFYLRDEISRLKYLKGIQELKDKKD